MIQAENGRLEVKGQKWEKLVDYSLKRSNYFLHSHQLFRFCFYELIVTFNLM